MVHHQDQITILHSPKVLCTIFLFEFCRYLEDQEISPWAVEQFCSWGQTGEWEAIQWHGRKMSSMKRNFCCCHVFRLGIFGCLISVLKTHHTFFNKKHLLTHSQTINFINMLSQWKTSTTNMYVDIDEEHNTVKWQNLLKVIKSMKLATVFSIQNYF